VRDSTRAIHAGQHPSAQGKPLMPGPIFAGTYFASGDPSQVPFTYGRYHNPTWTAFEEALAELEGGPSVVFASGMAAIAAVFGITLQTGDILVMPTDSYYSARTLARDRLAAQGIVVRSMATNAPFDPAELEGAKLLWLESPSNPGLDVCDVRAWAGAAHAHGVLVALDNTTPTPLGQQPLELGADFSISSDTKALTGHGDVVLGHVAVRDEAWARRLLAWRTREGSVPGPMEVWLAHRSLETLALRLDRQCANALAIAGYLAAHPAVRGVRYPGLPSHPAHELAKRQMRRFGPVVSFELADRTAAEHFLAACRLVAEATSFGGVHSTAERRARWGGDAVPEGFIRLSAGCEDIEDLLGDLEQALAAEC
jgi:cystathionine gamma-lyase